MDTTTALPRYSDSPFEVQNDDSDGETLAARYQVLEELGSGSFGVVYKAIERTSGEIVAIKHVDLENSEEDLSDIVSELAVLSSCSSSHVTKYKAAFVRRQTLWIIMEYLGGGSCADLLKPPPHSLPERHIAIICKELLLGLSYLHSEGKLHRDIKAANILLGMDGRVKLADFGVAAQLVGLKSVRNTFVGTPFWMAPEVIQEAGHDAKADVWSLGITAMELAHGEPPHSNVHPMKVLFQIPKQSAPRLEGGNWSKEFREFVAQCLTKDPDRRPSAREMLKHKFIKHAGKTESLQELVIRKQEWDASKGTEKNLKYYAETLRNLSAPKADDDWVFDTVKAVPTMDQRLNTQKRRKVESIVAEDEVIQPSTLPGPEASTMRKVSDNPTQQNTKKRVSSTQSRHPLGVNMSFGNSPSTVRQFRRVSPNAERNNENVEPSPSPTPNSSIIRTPSKEKPHVVSNPFLDSDMMPPPCSPTKPQQLTSPSKPSRFSTATTVNSTSSSSSDSKEATLGRRLYSNAVGLSCQEVLDTTGDGAKREAISRLAEAFSDLESVDPEGVYHIMTSIFNRTRADSKLKELLPQVEVQSRATSTSNTAMNSLVSNSPLKAVNGAKLVLAQNNPHLKSHHRRQSAQIQRSRDGSAVWSSSPNTPAGSRSPSKEKRRQMDEEEDRLRHDMKLQGDLDHTRQLADVLFERWRDGMKSRWPGM